MKFRIDPAAGVVTIDDRAVTINLAGFDPSISAVQWFGTAGIITYHEGGDEEGPRTERFTSTDAFAGFLAAAQAEILAQDTVVPPTLEEMKASALAEVAALAGAARARVVTPGKDAIYEEKARQARSFLDDHDPTEAKYPMIYDEVGITADTPLDVAQLVVANNAVGWERLRKIERVSLSAKRDIASAETPEALTKILSGLTWPQ